MDPLQDLKNKLGVGLTGSTPPAGGNLSVASPTVSSGNLSVASPNLQAGNLSVAKSQAPTTAGPTSNIAINNGSLQTPAATSLQGQNINLRQPTNVGGAVPAPVNIKPYVVPPPSAAAPLKVQTPPNNQLAQVAAMKTQNQPVIKAATPPPVQSSGGSTNAQAPTDTDSNLQKVGHALAGLGEGFVRPAVVAGVNVANTIGNAEVRVGNALGIKAKNGVQTPAQQFGTGITQFAGGENIGAHPTAAQARAYQKNANSPGNVISSGVQLGLDVGAPEFAGLLGKGVTMAAGAAFPDAASELATRIAQSYGSGLGEAAIGKSALSTGIRVATGPVVGAALGGPYNVAGQASSGQKLSPTSLAKTYAAGTGYGLLFGVGGEAVNAGIGGLMKVGSILHSQAGEPALKAAEESSDLNRNQVINDNQAVSLHNYANNPEAAGDLRNTMSANNAAKLAGVDITSGQPADIVNRINDYLDQRSNFISTHNAISQGGYIGNPGTTGTDRYGNNFTEDNVPVDQLVRDQQYQPRVTASAKATENNVFQKGYHDNPTQPMVVKKEGDVYKVLGGHSRTLGLERRAAEGLDNPTSVRARVYDNITPEQARQISRGANQGVQYEGTLDMAKSISDSRAEYQEPAVQKQNMIKGYTYDDYSALWDTVKNNQSLQEKIAVGAMPSDEVLAAVRQGRTENLPPDTIAAVLNGLERNGNFNRQNAINVIKLLSGKLRAGLQRDSQSGLFGDVGMALKTTDLLKEYQKVSADLVRKRNAINIAAQEIGDTGPIREALDNLSAEYDQRLQSIQDEIVNRSKQNAGVAIAKPEPATDALAERIKQNYTPSANNTPNERDALDYLLKNPQKAMSDYDQRVMNEFGTRTPNIVAGDEAKFVIPGMDTTKSVDYHEPGSALAKVKYEQLLADPTTIDKPVMVMSGGTGAGKTSALRNLGKDLDDFAAVVDTNSNKLDSATSKIRQALDSGRKVEINYVYRHPIDAFENGVLPRAAKIGRLVSVDAHLDTHFGSNEVINQLAQKYKDNPDVVINTIDNSRGPGNAVASTLDKLPEIGYNKDSIRNSIEGTLNGEYQKGNISPEDYATYTGRNPEVQTTNEEPLQEPSGEPQPQRQPGNISVAPTGNETQLRILPDTTTGSFKIQPQSASNVEEVLGHPINSDLYTGPNMNEGAFSPEDMASLGARLDAISDEAPDIKDADAERETQDILQKGGSAEMATRAHMEMTGTDYGTAHQEVVNIARDSNIPLEKTVDNYLTPEERQAIIDGNDTQQTKNIVQIKSVEGNTRGGIGEANGYADERQDRFYQAAQLAKKVGLDDHDKFLLSERADPKVTIDPHDPEGFAKVAAAYDDAYDYSLTADRAGGATTLRYGSGKYAPLYLAASKAQMDDLLIPEEDRIYGKYTGFRDKTREYRSYTDAGRVKLGRLYDSPLNDAAVYARDGDFPIRSNLLKAALMKTDRTEVSDRGARQMDENGKPFKQAAGSLDFDVSDKLNKQLDHYKQAWAPKNKIAALAFKGLRGAIAISKKALFFATPFHYANETVRFGGATILHPVIAVKGLSQALFSQAGGYNKLLDMADKDGSMDWVRKSGTPLQEVQKTGLIARSPEGSIKILTSLDPSRFFNRKLSEFGNTLTLSLARFANDNGIDPNSAMGSRLGEEYGKVIGRLNAAVQGHDPTFKEILSAGALAPDWISTSFGLIKDSAKLSVGPNATASRGVGLLNPGDVARGTVLGARALLAGAAIIGTAIATDKFPTMKQAFNEAGLNPNNPVPNIEGKAKNQKGESWVQDFPTDPLGLTVMLFSDPQHFASSRYSPFLAAAADAVFNRNWNGQQLATPGQPNYILDRILGGAKNLLPIAAQNATNPNISIKQGLLQDVGMRYKTNPNDPQVIANANYYKQNTNLTNILSAGKFSQLDPSLKDVSWQDAQQFVNTFNALHPPNTTDAGGQKFPQDYNAASSEVKYNAFTMTDPTTGQRVLSPVYYAEAKLETGTKGYPTSPLYSLTGTGLDNSGNTSPRALVALEYQNTQDPGGKTNLINANGGQNGWLSSYETKLGNYDQNYQSNMNNYFKSLGWTPTAINTYWSNHPSMPDPVDSISFPASTTNLMNQYSALDASGDSTAAAQFFTQNAAVLGQAFDLEAQHSNAIRAAAGFPQEQGYPTETPAVTALLNSMPTGSSEADKEARSNIINNNPAVNQYLADAALYESLDKGQQFALKNPANMTASEGVNINNGGQAGQQYLKDTSSLGSYDIGTNATTGVKSFMQGGGFPAGTVAGPTGTTSTYKPIIALPSFPKKPPRHSAGKLKIKREKVHKIQIKKAVNKPVVMTPTNVLKASNVIKIAK